MPGYRADASKAGVSAGGGPRRFVNNESVQSSAPDAGAVSAALGVDGRQAGDLILAAGVLPEPFQREQVNTEGFYRFHLTPNLAITPDRQYISNPSLNPDVDTLWVAGLRARLTF
jgi:hypothetical protein